MLLTEEQGEKSYCIHEVHYDEDGSVMGWTQNAIAVFVPSFAELILQSVPLSFTLKSIQQMMGRPTPNLEPPRASDRGARRKILLHS